VVLAAVIGALFVAVQWRLDERRADREAQAAVTLANQAEQLENLRFMRDRSSPEPIHRPFAGMDLDHVNFTGLQLAGSDLRGATISSSILDDIDLSGSVLTNAQIELSWSRNANLSGIDARCTSDSDLDCWFLNFVTLVDADLSGADLRDTRISFSYLARVDLSGSDLRNATFDYRTVLSDVDLSSANLDGAVFDGICHSGVLWPEGFSPPPSLEIGTDCSSIYTDGNPLRR
jgi:uncharacterized protein YjbI with pentapeptide repeats